MRFVLSFIFALALVGFATMVHAEAAESQGIEASGGAPSESGGANKASTEWEANYRSAGNRPGFGAGFREGPMGGIWQRSQLLGDPFGARSGLGKYGITLNIQETSEILGNTSGGVRQGFEYDGLTTLNLQLNTQRAFHLPYGLFNVSALEIHGHNLSQDNLKTLQTASGIEADNGLRLWELWYQQGFLYRQLDFRVGIQSLDQEFIYSQYAGLFVNTMFGWPMLTSADLLGGGPAYPLASLGARVKVQPAGTPWTALAGIFDDNPSGINSGSSDDPQRLNAHGTNFRHSDKALVIAEIQYSRPAVGEIEYPEDKGGILPGTYKLGAWYDFGQFVDQEYGTDGLSLANNSSNKDPQLYNGNYSIYAVIDQLIWRRSPESPEGVGVFLRAMGAPANQNLISYSVNAGITWRALLEHREYDVMGLGMGWAKLSNRVIGYDRDQALFGDPTTPVQSAETFLELTYQYQLVPWWQLQPDIQYVFNPGGGSVQSPEDPIQNVKVGNELVVGLRTNIVF